MNNDFNDKKFKALLDAIKHSIKCPSCDGNFIDSDVDMIAGLNEAYFVKLSCGSCGLNVVASLVNLKDGRSFESLVNLDMTEEDFELMDDKRSPISTDDLINVHEFLEDYLGDFK